MSVVCMDDKLNISKTYLKPGFAFGGSCLPKDLRAMKNYCKNIGVEPELISSVLDTNETVIQTTIEKIANNGFRKIVLIGLSFKENTDDIRESPMVELAKRLKHLGLDIEFYDPAINSEILIGENRLAVNRLSSHLQQISLEELELT